MMINKYQNIIEETGKIIYERTKKYIPFDTNNYFKFVCGKTLDELWDIIFKGLKK